MPASSARRHLPTIALGRVQALRRRVHRHRRVRQGRQDGKTDHVFFYDVGADGFSLDDKRDPISESDLPSALACWRKKSAKKDTDRTAKHFMVPVKEIAEKVFDLSINRYKEAKHEDIKYDPPKKIIARLRALESEIAKDLSELEGML
jgi:type I restriction enzyme M protein